MPAGSVCTRCRNGEPGHALAVEEVRVDPRHLRRVVGADAKLATRQAVRQAEGGEVEVAASARQERLRVFQERRLHQLVAVRGEEVEDRAAQALHRPRLGRQAASSAREGASAS